MADDIVPVVPPPPKPGYKTTEFWLTVAAQVIGTIVASGLLTETPGIPKAIVQIVGIASVVLASMGYSYSRGQVKSK